MQSKHTQPSVEGVAGNLSAAAGDAQLCELADEALRCAARGARYGERPDPAVRALMREACGVARARGLRAEQVLVVMKEAWGRLPEGLRLPRHQAGDVLASAITLCIDEYYSLGRGQS